MPLGRIILIQLSINCCIRHCSSCCLVPWAVTQSSRAAKRDVIGYNFTSWIIVDMSSIMLMRLQELCKSCRASCWFYFGDKWQNSCTNSCILFYCNGRTVLRKAISHRAVNVLVGCRPTITITQDQLLCTACRPIYRSCTFRSYYDWS